MIGRKNSLGCHLSVPVHASTQEAEDDEIDHRVLLSTQSRHRDSPRKIAVASHVSVLQYRMAVLYCITVLDNRASVIDQCFSSRSFAYRTQLAQKENGLWIYLYHTLCPHVAEGLLAMCYRYQRFRLFIDEGSCCYATCPRPSVDWGPSPSSRTCQSATQAVATTSCQCIRLGTEVIKD